MMTTFAGVHALIVEDDASSVEVLIDLFQQLKVSYTALFDSRNVLQMMSQLGRVDVVFLDLEMPNSNGYEVLQEIQSSPDFGDIPVVAYTSHNSEMANARDAGFHSFLGKPLRGKEFGEQLEKILNRESVWVVR